MPKQETVESSGSVLQIQTPKKQFTWYFVTNQLNLIYMLAAGMIMAPRGFGEKYYGDSLNVKPGWIPIFSKTVPREALNTAVKESRTLTPVIVALNLSSLKGGARAVSLNGKVSDIRLPEELTLLHPCIFVPAPLPTEFIECIHFANIEEKKAFEQEATNYKNLPIGHWKRKIRKQLFSKPSHGHWPEYDGFPDTLNIRMDNYQAAGGIMAMLLNCGNLGGFSMLACQTAFDGAPSDKKPRLEGTILEGLEQWMRDGVKPPSNSVLNDLYWGIVDQIVQNDLNTNHSTSLEDSLLNFLERFKENTETKYAKALSELILDLKELVQFGSKNTSELLESHSREVRRALILFFLHKRCLDLIKFPHPLLTERDYIAAALLFAAREKWIGMPLELRDFPGADGAISHRMAAMAHKILKTDLDLGPPPPRCRPLRELLKPKTDEWTKKQEAAALYLARSMKWPCIKTRIRIGKGDYKLRIDSGGINIEFPGEVRAVDTKIEEEKFFKMMEAKRFIDKKMEVKARKFLAS